MNKQLLQQIREFVTEPGFRSQMAQLLMDICEVDTTPFSDVDRMRAAESAVFARLEQELAALPFNDAALEHRPIDPNIARHPAFSLLHFTKTEERPQGLTPKAAYRDRGNLLFIIRGSDAAAGGIAMNAHIDVVKPFFPPSLRNKTIHGRGACDDKGAVVAIIGALKIIGAILKQRGEAPRKNIVSMFVIEEETGGNGSLSLALDREVKTLYDAIIVQECTGLVVHPANRGAVWYQAILTHPHVSLFEMAAFVIAEMEQEGRALKAESRHPLFPQRPVQTCHGIMGPYGEHPSRICGEIAFELLLSRPLDEKAEALMRDSIDSGLHTYTALYGDKTQAKDPDSGLPKVARHYDCRRTPDGYCITVYGSTGHMGSILENDGAITKMCSMVRSLIRSRPKLEELSGQTFAMRLAGTSGKENQLKLEGGQGFIPTHSITEVMERMRGAALAGAGHYLQLQKSQTTAAAAVTVTYDKLHNDAFDGDPNSQPMQNAVAAARACGTWDGEDIFGWTVSCDARLFAGEYPEMPVLTCGAGDLARAHADEEQLSVDELCRNIEFLSAFLLLEIK